MNNSAPTILIVDDEESNRKLLEVLLHHKAYLTRHADSGAQALASVAEQEPDLILLDVMMPGMNGFEVASKLKSNALTSHIPIIMITALVDQGARVAGLEAGAEEFLTRPVDRAELWLRVRNLLRLKEYGDLLHNHSHILDQQVQARTAELQRFRSAMDATTDAIFLIDHTRLRFVEVNATACAMTGYAREELLQMGPANIAVVPMKEVQERFTELIAGRGVNEVRETEIRRRDGSLLAVEAHQHARLDGAGWMIVNVLHGIGERKRAEQEILRLNAQLEHRVEQRTAQLQAANEELEAFSYSVSHDLRSPLSSIDGFSGLLVKELGTKDISERSRHHLARIRSAVAQMGELIDALLQLAHVSRAGMSWDDVDLSAMAETLMAAHREREPLRRVQLEIQRGLVVRGDRRLLRQLMANLLDNAWKFSALQPQASIAFACEIGADGLPMYAVRDNGAGFDMAHAQKLFGTFQRLHTASEFAGTGIGLATVHRIVARHGGKVWAEAAPGQGASFYFTLGGKAAATLAPRSAARSMAA